MNSAQTQVQTRASGPKFATGAGNWPRVNGADGRTQSSDSSTEREYSNRSTSRSDPSSHSQARGPNGRHHHNASLSNSNSNSTSTNTHNHRHSPEGRISASIETSPDPSPPIPFWSAKRHLTCGNPTPGPPWSSKNIAWRGSAPGKLKTANAALVLCLNIDVDPPDVVKTNPCAVLECWVDPHTMPSEKALQAIGSNLQHQFEGLSLKIAYKPILDPSLEDLRRFCQQSRKQAKDDAVLFYYNGHGVPKPTASGELWCFNKSYTQYIPVSLQEIQGWLGSPGVYIWDCSAAGNLLTNFNIYAERRDHEVNTMHGGYPEGVQPMMNSLQLAACGANETLPSCPELPADVFTSCLTSPIDIALRYFIMNHHLPNNITQDMVMQLPGDLKDRRTPLGELNWIFTAITDTIAWTTFSRDTFTRLYRCDLLIASLFRNFLLAERIMKNHHCTPHTYPPLPSTNTHPLWATWDLAVDTCLRQLPDLLSKSASPTSFNLSVPSGSGTTPGRIGSTARVDPSTGRVTAVASTSGGTGEKPYVYVPSRFFADQLTAFEVWISRGGSALTRKGPLSLPQTGENGYLSGASTSTSISTNPSGKFTEPISPTPAPAPAVEIDQHAIDHHLVPRKPPDQLPIVLQVLLSQPHRLRALILLSQFVDLGPWAVHLVLTIGIFPYISKLLQAQGQDLRPVLIFIWARILAVDASVQTDLYNNQGYKYFANILGLKNEDNLPNSSEHKAMCSFILASISRDFPYGQVACWNERVFDNCYERLEDHDFLLRQWTALCIAQMWDGNDEIKVYGVDRGTQDKLITMLSDDSAEVRAAALYALGTFMGASGSADALKQGGGGSGTMYQLEERVHFRMEVAVATGATLAIKDDASPMCRKELLVVVSCLVKEWRGYFVVCAWIYWEEDRRWRAGGGGAGGAGSSAAYGSSSAASHGLGHGSQGPYGHGGGHGQGHGHSQEEDITTQAVSEWLDSFGDDEMLREENRVLLSSFFTIYVLLLDLTVDPYEEVATNAQTIADYITALLLESPFTRLESTSLHVPPADGKRGSGGSSGSGSPQLSTRSRAPSLASPSLPHLPYTHPPPSPSYSDRPGMARQDSIASTLVGSTIKRTSSFANALKNFAGGIAFPGGGGDGDGRASPSLASTLLPSQLRPVEKHHDYRADVSRPPSPNMNLARYTSPYPPSPAASSDGGTPQSYFDMQGGPGQGQQKASSHAEFLPCDVMEALMEEDMERLRARRKATRRSHQHQYGSHGSGGLPSPSNSTFSMDSNGSSVILGLGTGAGIRDMLPLKSTFYDWCAEYFKEPQMRQAEADEPGSVQYNYQVWRQLRNEHVIKETDTQAQMAETGRWDRAVASFSVSGYPLTMAFHSYDKHLVLANEHNMISVFDWQTRKRLNYFCNGNPKGTSITALEIINQDVGGIILTGSADGIVRLYRNYDPTLEQGPLQMVSAFRGLNEMVQSRQGTGVVFDWKQSSGFLLIGGDSRVIKVWDAGTETQGLDLETNSESPVTAITSDSGSSKTFLASFADGVVKLFDRRLEDEDAIVRTYADRASWVQNVRWHPTLSGQFLSAGIDGQVKLFDLRGNDYAAQTWNVHPYGLSSFDVHPIANVFAATSAITPTYWRSQRIAVQNLSKTIPLTKFDVTTGLNIPPVRGLPSPFIPRSSSLVFHPLQMLYATGEPDGTVMVRGCSPITNINQ